MLLEVSQILLAEPVVAIHGTPYILTKLMKPVVVTMKSLGIRMVLYLDDMILMANSQGAPLVCSQSPDFPWGLY